MLKEIIQFSISFVVIKQLYETKLLLKSNSYTLILT